MNKREYEVVKKLLDNGYKATILLSESGFVLKVKRMLNEKEAINPQTTVGIEPKAIAIVQKFEYVIKEINVEEYDKGNVTRLVPCLLCTKEYSDE